MTQHDTAFVFASFDTLLCLTEHGSLFLCNKRKILMIRASWHTATVLTEISFVYRAKKACPCHHHYAGNPVEGHISKLNLYVQYPDSFANFYFVQQL